jgi:hypothetical protein
MEFNRVIKGVQKFLSNEIYSKMNDWQEMLLRIAVTRTIGNTETLKETLKNNSFVKMFSIMDEQGNVEIDELLCDVKSQICEKGKITFSVPLFGTISFLPEDVDTLRRYIMEE